MDALKSVTASAGRSIRSISGAVRLSPLLATIGILACVLPVLEGQDAEGWKDLTDEPSRRQLFDDVIKANLQEKPREGEPQPTPFAIPQVFVFPNDARIDATTNKPRSNVVFGIDVSHYDDKDLDFELLSRQQVSFVYVKATQGTGYKDPRFGYFWKGIGSVEVDQRPLKGAYHFLSAGIDGKRQAERFVEFVKQHGGFPETDLPPCVDVEWDKACRTCQDRWEQEKSDEILNNVIAWLQRTKELTRRTPCIYTSRAWWNDCKIPASKIALLKEYPIWIADYSRSQKASEKPLLIGNQPQTIWQFAEDAKLTNGYLGGSLDASIFYGSETDFERRLGVKR